jgi:hypothetical protein
MEAGRDNGLMQARRCLEALKGETDVPTRVSLWAAAKKFHQRDREHRAGLEFGTALPHALSKGLSGTRV